MKFSFGWVRGFGFGCALLGSALGGTDNEVSALWRGFQQPPPDARPGVYWYFLDGNRDSGAMTQDLEAMTKMGIGSMVFLEVDLGVPRGPVEFMSDPWQDMFVHAVREAERLGLEVILGTGPGWTGSGGPWVPLEESMQHIVASRTVVHGPATFHGKLEAPPPRRPYFGIPADLEKARAEFFRDIGVLAFRTPPLGSQTDVIGDLDEKALYYRGPYSSMPGVKPYLPAPTPDMFAGRDSVIAQEKIIDLTTKLQPDGSLTWEVPEGNWTILRFVARNNGANTRPAPLPGYGPESDKFSQAAIDAHLDHYARPLLKKIGTRTNGTTGWTTLHMDSWEMGAQNWTPKFREEFTRRRGYDPLKYLPVVVGELVDSKTVSERFLWDWRQTAHELVLENHAGYLRDFAHEKGMKFSVEPYDMNPTADLGLGGIADLPMGEFWANGFNSAYSCIEATSIGHTMGRAVIGAESFTSEDSYQLHPAAIKNQLDWAFGIGLNRIVFHTFQHQPLGPDALPGLSFGPYGINWHRNQTWWPMTDAIHRYIARCSYLLRQGAPVADVLYLTPEGAPQVFAPPRSALVGEEAHLPDRRGFNFDGCDPQALLTQATVKDGRVVFPGGASYRILVLPAVETMTPALLAKIRRLVEAGATIVGAPPKRSPGLSNYPKCDEEIAKLANELWGGVTPPTQREIRTVGQGQVVWGGKLRMAQAMPPGELYPPYQATTQLLHDLGAIEDFSSAEPLRYSHRRGDGWDVFFVANRSEASVSTKASFRVAANAATRWDAQTGTSRAMADVTQADGVTTATLELAPFESCFVVFGAKSASVLPVVPALAKAATLEGAWEVRFPAGRGAPERVTFDALVDWTERPEPGVRYFSGIATYRKEFDRPAAGGAGDGGWYLDLGAVRDLCRVRLNGQDLGVVWSAPWRMEITSALKEHGNVLEIEVANRWINRLIGDAQPADKDARTLSWKSGLLAGKEFKTGRYTFAYPPTPFVATTPLVSAGLLGPVTLWSAER